MLKNIEYPAGFGPDDSLPLNIKNAFMVDIPPGHKGIIRVGSQGDDPEWEQAICIYSMHSGAKVWECGNYNRYIVHSWSMLNSTPHILSYLITAWHKNSPPNPNEAWHQTGELLTRFAYNSERNPAYTFVEMVFNAYGDLSTIPFIKSSAVLELSRLPN